MSMRRSTKRTLDSGTFAEDELDVAGFGSDGGLDGAGEHEVSPGEQVDAERRFAVVADEAPRTERTEFLSSPSGPPVDVDRPFGFLPPMRHPSVDSGARHILSRRDPDGIPSRIAVVGPRHRVGVSTLAESLCHVLQSDFGLTACHLDLANTAPVKDGLLRPALDRFGIGDAEIDAVVDNGVASLRLGEVSDDEWYSMVRSEEFAGTLRRLDAAFDFLVVELPPLLEGSRALSMMRYVEAFVTVAQHGVTTIADVQTLQEELRGRDQLGVVLNRYRSRVPRRLGRRLGIR